MAEYIERDALYKTVAKNVEVFDDAGANIKEQCLEHIVIAEPAADVVEVVRCKDCRIGKGNTPKMGAGWIYCNNNDQYHKETHFCGYGERKCEE